MYMIVIVNSHSLGSPDVMPKSLDFLAVPEHSIKINLNEICY